MRSLKRRSRFPPDLQRPRRALAPELCWHGNRRRSKPHSSPAFLDAVDADSAHAACRPADHIGHPDRRPGGPRADKRPVLAHGEPDEHRAAAATALQSASQQVRLRDFRFFCSAVILQQSSGGNLVSTLEELSQIMQKRRTMRLKAHAATSEVRFTAFVLGALPFVVIAAMLAAAPDYLDAAIQRHARPSHPCAWQAGWLLALLLMRAMMRIDQHGLTSGHRVYPAAMLRKLKDLRDRRIAHKLITFSWPALLARPWLCGGVSMLLAHRQTKAQAVEKRLSFARNQLGAESTAKAGKKSAGTISVTDNEFGLSIPEQAYIAAWLGKYSIPASRSTQGFFVGRLCLVGSARRSAMSLLSPSGWQPVAIAALFAVIAYIVPTRLIKAGVKRHSL